MFTAWHTFIKKRKRVVGNSSRQYPPHPSAALKSIPVIRGLLFDLAGEGEVKGSWKGTVLLTKNMWAKYRHKYGTKIVTCDSNEYQRFLLNKVLWKVKRSKYITCLYIERVFLHNSENSFSAAMLAKTLFSCHCLYLFTKLNLNYISKGLCAITPASIPASLL